MTRVICPFDKEEFPNMAAYTRHVSEFHSGGMGAGLEGAWLKLKSLKGMFKRR